MNRRLAFHKIGQDGSGRCDIPVQTGGVVHGVVYRRTADSIAVLDWTEGARAAGFPTTCIDAPASIELVRNPDVERVARRLAVYHD